MVRVTVQKGHQRWALWLSWGIPSCPIDTYYIRLASHGFIVLSTFPLPINLSPLLPSSPRPHSSLHHILSSTLLYLYPFVYPSFSPYLFAHQIPTVLFIWVCTRYLLGSNDTGGIFIGRPRVNSIRVTTHIQSWNEPHNDRSSAPTVTGLLHVTLICVQPLSSVLPWLTFNSRPSFTG